ncbi:hypothetical protein P3X46_015055 [Hevea brasiliensis]|uniref:UspA domain-containing protein n=1 Tax=Hevea brasiliensis TaxID=3981 RepID=A0ABQ9LUQ5_HEVBR|nr:hypothetical protein P3X46_015055 [Hevea brasiliensis]
MMAVDESKESMHALSWCLANLVSATSNSTLVLLYVKPPPSIYSAFDIAAKSRKRSWERRGKGCVICNTVEKLGADTLVMGSHGYGFLERAILGSVSDHCAKHAKCPVVIVKQPEEN